MPQGGEGVRRGLSVSREELSGSIQHRARCASGDAPPSDFEDDGHDHGAAAGGFLD